MQSALPALTSTDAANTRHIDGLRCVPLTSHRDHRGAFTEIFRKEWATGIEPIQWNVVRSSANALRGFHVHVTHSDYLTVIHGEMLLGLRDIRPWSPSHGSETWLRLDANDMQAVCIPPGVAHGFYFAREAIHMYSVSHYWDPHDELGCRWDDVELNMRWPTSAPLLSPRDADAGTFPQMVEAFVRGSCEVAR